MPGVPPTIEGPKRPSKEDFVSGAFLRSYKFHATDTSPKDNVYGQAIAVDVSVLDKDQSEASERNVITLMCNRTHMLVEASDPTRLLQRVNDRTTAWFPLSLFNKLLKPTDGDVSPPPISSLSRLQGASSSSPNGKREAAAAGSESSDDDDSVVSNNGPTPPDNWEELVEEAPIASKKRGSRVAQSSQPKPKRRAASTKSRPRAIPKRVVVDDSDSDDDSVDSAVSSNSSDYGRGRGPSGHLLRRAAAVADGDRTYHQPVDEVDNSAFFMPRRRTSAGPSTAFADHFRTIDLKKPMFEFVYTDLHERHDALLVNLIRSRRRWKNPSHERNAMANAKIFDLATCDERLGDLRQYIWLEDLLRRVLGFYLADVHSDPSWIDMMSREGLSNEICLGPAITKGITKERAKYVSALKKEQDVYGSQSRGPRTGPSRGRGRQRRNNYNRSGAPGLSRGKAGASNDKQNSKNGSEQA